MITIKHSNLRVNKGALLAIAFVMIITLVSACITSVDPIAEWDDTLISVIWLVGLTIATMMMFSYGISNGAKEWVIVIVAWFVRVLFVTANNSGIFTFRGDPFFEMAHGLYYGFDHVYGGVSPVTTHYPAVLVEEFKIFGINRLVTCYVNAFFTMIAIYYLLKCFRLLNINKRVSAVLLFLFSFNPFSILFGCEVFREAIYLPLAAISLYFFVRWTMSFRARHLIIAMIPILPMAWLHSGYIVIVAAYIVVAFFHLKHITRRRLVYKIVLVAGVVVIATAVFVVFYSYFSAMFLSKLSRFNDIDEFSAYFDMVQGSVNSNSGSQYLQWMLSPFSVWKLVIYTPIRVFYFLCSPMIWDCYRMQDIVAFFTDSLVFLAAHIMVLRFLINKRSKTPIWGNRTLVLIGTMIVIAVVSVPFAWGTFNAGTALRHRNCLLPFVCVQIGICYTMMRGRRFLNSGNISVIELANNS